MKRRRKLHDVMRRIGFVAALLAIVTLFVASMLPGLHTPRLPHLMTAGEQVEASRAPAPACSEVGSAAVDCRRVHD
jgi:hypothetical protein